MQFHWIKNDNVHRERIAESLVGLEEKGKEAKGDNFQWSGYCQHLLEMKTSFYLLSFGSNR